jgi:PAS domain S-box-containing protein
MQTILVLLQIGVASVTFGTAVAAGVAWMQRRMKRFLVADIMGALKPTLDELRPNGGGSMLDMIRRIDTTVVRVGAMQRLLIGVTNGAVWECDADGRCTYGSPALCELFGLSSEEFVGAGWTSAIVNQRQRQDAWMEWQSAIKAGVPYAAEYVVRNHRTGERFIARASGHPVVDGKHVVIGFLGTVDKVANVTDTQLETTIAGTIHA